MAWFDMFALGVVAACAVISMTRGAVAEVVALMTWIAAFLAAKIFAVPFADAAFKTFEPRVLAVALSFAAVFALSLLALRLLRSLLTSAVSSVGLGGVNRLLGGVFGAAKGVVLVVLAVMLASFSDLPQSGGWKDSVSAPLFETLADSAVPYLKDRASRAAEGRDTASDGITDTEAGM